jgi:hypothetical protein
MPSTARSETTARSVRAQERVDAILDVVDRADELGDAAPAPRKLLHEPAVRGLSDPDDVEARLAQGLLDRGKDLLFVPHGAVGDEHDAPQRARIASLRHRERFEERRQDLGAASYLQALDPRPRRVELGASGRHEASPEGIELIVELDHVEGVVRPQPSEGGQEAPASPGRATVPASSPRRPRRTPFALEERRDGRRRGRAVEQSR